MGELGLSVGAYAAGCAIAGLYLACLWAGARSLTGRRSVAAFMGLTALRVGLVTAALAFAIALELGAGAILAGLAGFVTVRIATTRRVERPRKEAA